MVNPAYLTLRLAAEKVPCAPINVAEMGAETLIYTLVPGSEVWAPSPRRAPSAPLCGWLEHVVQRFEPSSAPPIVWKACSRLARHDLVSLGVSRLRSSSKARLIGSFGMLIGGGEGDEKFS